MWSLCVQNWLYSPVGVQESPSVIPTAVQAVTSPSPCCAGGALAHIRMHTQFSEDLLDHLRLLGHLNQENSCSPRGVFPSVVAAGRSLAAGTGGGCTRGRRPGQWGTLHCLGPGPGQEGGTWESPSGGALSIDGHPEHRPSIAPQSHSYSPSVGWPDCDWLSHC